MQPSPRFQASREFGTMWHSMEESYAGGMTMDESQANLKVCATDYAKQFPLQADEINRWFNVCRVLFPIYVDYWKRDKEEREKTPLLQEYTFNVPYTLPSGRVVYLRGKFDGVDLIGKGKSAGVFLFETKTKSEIVEEQIRRQLKFDLQTCLYLIALHEEKKTARWPIAADRMPILGVRYNVIRRPLAGGKGSIRQHAPTKSKPEGETQAEFYERLKGVILEDVGTYFLRIKSEVYPSDIERFKRMCLNPLLEQLCDWYELMQTWGMNSDVWEGSETHGNNCHYMSPYGLYNPLVEAGQTDLDYFLETGSEVGLQRVEKLFTELQ